MGKSLVAINLDKFCRLSHTIQQGHDGEDNLRVEKRVLWIIFTIFALKYTAA